MLYVYDINFMLFMHKFYTQRKKSGRRRRKRGKNSMMTSDEDGEE